MASLDDELERDCADFDDLTLEEIKKQILHKLDNAWGYMKHRHKAEQEL